MFLTGGSLRYFTSTFLGKRVPLAGTGTGFILSRQYRFFQRMKLCIQL